MLHVDHVSVRFGGLQALDAVSFDVAAGSVTGLIGPNGAGKTTMFNVVTGLQRPDGGRVLLDGADITRARPNARARLGLARTFQRIELFGTLSVRENVQVAAEVAQGLRHRRSSPAAVADELLERVGLTGVADLPSDVLPTGTARLVEVARALATDPRLLLLDEPSSGLSGAESAALGRLLTGLAADGMAVLLVEHDMDLVMSVCSALHVLDFGQVIAVGSPAQIQQDARVQEAYLGAAPDPVHPARPSGGVRPMTAALELRGVTAGYGPVSVVHDIDLVVPPASVLALLGPNGAGKSTVLRVAGGRLRPVAGMVLVEGDDVTGRSPEKLARHGVCTIPEGRGVFPNLTVAENLRMWTYRGGTTRAAVEDLAYERFPRLRDRRGQLAGTLSGGEQQMLAMSRALSTNPRLLLLDEISMGLAPIIVGQLYDIVAQVAAEGFAILLVEQFARTALAVADQAAIMAHGRVVLSGSPAEVEAAAAEVYLGADRPVG